MTSVYAQLSLFSFIYYELSNYFIKPVEFSTAHFNIKNKVGGGGLESLSGRLRTQGGMKWMHLFRIQLLNLTHPLTY